LLANPAPQAVDALRQYLPVSGTLRVGIIAALGERRDVAAVKELIDEAAKPETEVRLAAMAALAEIGDPRAEAALADGWRRGSVADRRRAMAAYLRLAERLREDNREQVSDQIYGRVLAMSGDTGLLAAALRGLAVAGSARHVPAMVELLLGDLPILRAEAAKALATMPDGKVTPALVERYQLLAPRQRTDLLYVLAGRHDEIARQALDAAAQEMDAEVRVTALHLLGRLDDPAQETWLLTAAREGTNRVHPIALGAYLRLAQASLEAGDRERASTMFRGALVLARTADLRRTALHGLGQVGGDEVLPALRRCLSDPAIRVEAVRSLAGLALRLAPDQAADALREALSLGPPGDLIGPLVDRLKQRGEQVDPARAAGFVTTWWVAGPYPGTAMDKVWPPEQGVQLDQPLSLGDADGRWQRHHTDDTQGRLELTALLAPHDNVTAYFYTEVTVDRAHDVMMRTGTDDALRGWLNGEVFVFFGEPRGLQVDQDVATAHLQAGVNHILLKINQGGGGWGGCLRLTDPDGRGIVFTQREE
jgi:HEAT repeat protein